MLQGAGARQHDTTRMEVTQVHHLHVEKPTRSPERFGRQLLLPRAGLEVEDKEQRVYFQSRVAAAQHQ